MAYVCCKIKGCLRSSRTRGMCNTHYQQWKRNNILEPKPHPDLSIRGKTKLDRLINVKSIDNVNKPTQDYDFSLCEYYAMRRVMKETEGRGGPWFEQYAIKKGLL